MHSPKPVVVAFDPAQNLLRIEFVGDIGANEIQEYEGQVGVVLAMVGRDFRLVTDLTALNSMDVLCAPFIERTMELFRNHGVRRVVRIIPDRRKDIGFKIMSLFHYPRGVQIITCDNRAEAERALR